MVKGLYPKTLADFPCARISSIQLWLPDPFFRSFTAGSDEEVLLLDDACEDSNCVVFPLSFTPLPLTLPIQLWLPDPFFWSFAAGVDGEGIVPEGAWEEFECAVFPLLLTPRMSSIQLGLPDPYFRSFAKGAAYSLSEDAMHFSDNEKRFATHKMKNHIQVHTHKRTSNYFLKSWHSVTVRSFSFSRIR